MHLKIIFFFFSINVLANEQVRQSSYNCNQATNGTFIKDISSLSKSTTCIGFAVEKVREMCKCHKSIYGKTLSNDVDFKAFKDDLEDFDSSITAQIEFISDTKVQKMATLMNFIGSLEKPQIYPFSKKGVCTSKIKSIYSKGDEFRVHKIPELLDQKRNFDFLSKEGITKETFYQKMENLNQNNEERIGDDYDLFLVSSLKTKEPSTHTSNQVIIEGMCKKILKSLKKKMKEEKLPTISGIFIDKETNISQKSLSEKEIPSFLGLKSLYLSEKTLEDHLSEPYFNNLLCQNLVSYNTNEETNDKQNANGHNKDDLKEEILNLLSFMEQIDKEFRASSVELEKAETNLENQWNKLANILNKQGINPEDIKIKTDSLSLTNNEINQANQIKEFLDSNDTENLPSKEYHQIFNQLNNYLNAKRVNNEIFQLNTDTMRLQAENQFKLDDLFEELTNLTGSKDIAYDYIGEENYLSRTSHYYLKVQQTQNIALELKDMESFEIGKIISEERERATRFNRIVTRILSEDEGNKSLTEEEREMRRKALFSTKNLTYSNTDRDIFRTIRDRGINLIEKNTISESTKNSSLRINEPNFPTERTREEKTRNLKPKRSRSEKSELLQSYNRYNKNKDYIEKELKRVIHKIDNLNKKKEVDKIKATNKESHKYRDIIKQLNEIQNHNQKVTKKERKIRKKTDHKKIAKKIILPNPTTRQSAEKEKSKLTKKHLKERRYQKNTRLPKQQNKTLTTLTTPSTTHSYISGHNTSEQKLDLDKEFKYTIIKNHVSPSQIKQIQIDFLSLTNNEKIDFIKGIFKHQEFSSIFIRQKDGEIILLQKAEIQENVNILSNNYNVLVKDQNEIIFRLHDLNKLLESIKN